MGLSTTELQHESASPRADLHAETAAGFRWYTRCAVAALITTASLNIAVAVLVR